MSKYHPEMRAGRGFSWQVLTLDVHGRILHRVDLFRISYLSLLLSPVIDQLNCSRPSLSPVCFVAFVLVTRAPSLMLLLLKYRLSLTLFILLARAIQHFTVHFALIFVNSLRF